MFKLPWDFPSSCSEILNPRVKLAIFEEETWEDEDASEYTNGCRRWFLDAYINRPSNAASDSTTNAQPTISSRSAETAFHDDVEYQEMVAQRSFKRRRNDFD